MAMTGYGNIGQLSVNVKCPVTHNKFQLERLESKNMIDSAHSLLFFGAISRHPLAPSNISSAGQNEALSTCTCTSWSSWSL